MEGCGNHGPFEEMPSISVVAAAKSFLRSRSEVARRFVRQKIQSEMAIDEKMGGMKIAPLPLLAAATAIAVAAATPFTAAKNFRDDFARFFRRYDGRRRRCRQNGLVGCAKLSSRGYVHSSFGSWRNHSTSHQYLCW